MLANYTIDNVSPMISYSPPSSWRPGTIADDPFAPRYSDGTFSVTQVPGATMSFVFNGTSVWVFGAKRGNHGNYDVLLDGTTTTLNGAAPGDGLFQAVLFQAECLLMGLHRLDITNSPLGTNPFLDIDFITWTSTATTTQDRQTEDSDPAFKYTPEDAWSLNVSNGFSNSSVYATTQDSATVAYDFVVSDSVALYGNIGPSHGPYSVSVDGTPARTFTAFNPEDHTRQLKFFADNLGGGPHSVVLTNRPARVLDRLDIDFAVAVPAPKAGADPSPAIPTTLIPAVVGGVVGGVLFVALVTFFFFCWRRRKRRKRKEDEERRPSETPLAPGYMQYGQPRGYDQSSYNPNASGQRSRTTSTYQQSAWSGTTPGGGGLVTVYPQPQYVNVPTQPGFSGQSTTTTSLTSYSYHQGHGSSVSSSSMASTTRYGNPTIEKQSTPLPPLPDQPAPEPTSAEAYQAAFNLQPHPSFATGPTQTEEERPTLTFQKGPRTAGPPPGTRQEAHNFIVTPESILRNKRMVVEGRPQDFGPVDAGDLPPNYLQAVEPLSPPTAGQRQKRPI